MVGKKKILHLIQSLDNGGCENMLLRTLPLLTDEFEHHIITLRALGELAPRFAEKGIPVTTVHWHSFSDISGYRRLLSETRQFAPDTIITYLFHADMVGRLFLQRNVSAIIIPFLRTTYNHPRYLIARILEWLTKPFVRHYLANSEAVKDFYVRYIGVAPAQITVIPNGIDTDFFDQLAPDLKLRESLSIASEDFIITCVANLHPNKGHRFLLEAFECLWPDFPHAKLLLIGNGEERQSIERMIQSFRSRDAIRLLGRRDDVPALLKISDLFVLPTLFEGQSNAILEAMAAGVPVITTDIPENRVLIVPDEGGLLIAPENSILLAESIKKMLLDTNSRNLFEKNSKEMVKREFRLASIAKKLSYFFTTL
jgi:glycosyltransferase involved in cell wall biosynthesis